MKFIDVINLISQMIKKNESGMKENKTNLWRVSKLSQISEVNSFYQRLCSNFKISNDEKISNLKIIQKLVRAFVLYFFVVFLLNTASLLSIMAQPFINNKFKQIIARKFDGNIAVLLLEIGSIFLLYKIVNSLLFLIADFLCIILGVRVYSTLTLTLIRKLQTNKLNNRFVACLEDDCERVGNMPVSVMNSAIKIAQFIALCILLISRLPNYKVTVGIFYSCFMVICLASSKYSQIINSKIMLSKQKRIEFGNKSKQQIMKQRENQLGQIRKMMVINGLAFVLPWILNITLMAVIYGLVEIPSQDKFFVLAVFGMVRSTVSSVIVNLNILGQGWSSLSRLTNYINTSPFLSSEGAQQLINQKSQQQVKNYKHKNKESKDFKLSRILQLCSQRVYLFKPILLFLVLMLLIAHFLYGYCAKSILRGQSIFKPLNIVTLVLELVMPITLLAFICYSNQHLSKSVYERIFQKQREQKDNWVDKHINSDSMNRLSGDIRLLDRQLYLSAYGLLSNMATIASSFLYSCVVLANAFSILIIVLVIASSAILLYICYKFMKIRKQCYRRQANNKGLLLHQLKAKSDPIPNWKNIFNYKYFGYNIEIVFLGLLYLLMIMLSTAIIVVVMVSSAATIEETEVIVIMITGIDSQFLIIFIQLILLQTSTAAVNRCFNMLDLWDQEAKNGESSVQKINEQTQISSISNNDQK